MLRNKKSASRKEVKILGYVHNLSSENKERKSISATNYWYTSFRLELKYSIEHGFEFT